MSGLRDPNDPVIPPPPGVESNFDDPPNGNAMMESVVSLGLALTILLFGLRAYAQLFVMKRKPFREDYIALPALAAYIAFCTTIYMITNSSGYFVHGWDMRFRQLTRHRFTIFLTTTFYNVTMIFLKTAILVQWARIFVPGKRNIFYWLCYAVAAGNVIFYLATILIEWLRCRPVQFYWDRTIDGHCVQVDHLSPVSAILNLVFDVMILLLPQKAIWTLNMSWQKKMGVSLVFLVGLLACIFASIRLSYAVGYLATGDFTYDPSWQVFYGSLELLCGFLTFSLPVLPKPLRIVVEQSSASIRIIAQASRGASSQRSKSKSKTAGDSTFDSSRGHDFVPLRETGSSKSLNPKNSNEDPEWSVQDGPQYPDKKVVVRSTSFHISESSVSNHTADVFHPWTQDGYDGPGAAYSQRR